jgi:hypothetical protein
VDQDVRVSNKDVQRVAKGVKSGARWEQAFPGLIGVATKIEGAGAMVTVRSSKTEGMPVRYVRDDANGVTEAAAIREFDLQKRFHLFAADLAKNWDSRHPDAWRFERISESTRRTRVVTRSSLVHKGIQGFRTTRSSP